MIFYVINMGVQYTVLAMVILHINEGDQNNEIHTKS